MVDCPLLRESKMTRMGALDGNVSANAETLLSFEPMLCDRVTLLVVGVIAENNILLTRDSELGYTVFGGT